MTSATKLMMAGALLGGSLVGACGPMPQDIDYQDTTAPQPSVQFPDRDYVDPGVVPGGAAPLNGSVKNALTGEYVSQVELYTSGITPPVTGASDGAGAFALEIPVGSVFWMRAYKTGYAYTYDKVDMSLPAAQYTQNVYIVSQTDVDAMATAFGKTQNPSCGMILGTAYYGGQNQANVADISVSGASYEGPYFLDENNAPDPGADYTSAGGKFVYFNVCNEGQATVQDGKLISVQAQGGHYGPPKFINIYQGAVTLVKIDAEPNGVEPPPPDPENIIDYTTEIHPIWAKYGCSGCHANNAGAAAYGTGLFFNEVPDQVYYLITSRPGVIDLAYPAQSKLLYKPLVEGADDPPDTHPNGSFDNVYNEDYQAILQWIEAGAPFGVAPPPPVDLGPPEYITDIHPIWQNRGCTACHDTATPDGGLDLQGGPYQVQQYIEQYLVDVDYPEYSPLLNNPYCGDDPAKCANAPYGRAGETHATEVFVTNTDPDYVKIKAWLEYIAPNLVAPPVDYEYGTNVAIETQMYRFASLECVRCHSQQGASGGLVLEGTQYQIYQSLTDPAQNPNAVYPNDPEQSNVYTKPNAYYAQVNHDGGKAVPDRLDNYAKYIGGWIYEGAAAPPDVYPDGATALSQDIFGPAGLACTGCHNAAQAANYGNLALDGTPADIYANLQANGLIDPGYYIQQSGIIQKPFIGNGNQLYANYGHGGPKKNIAQYYNQYWILQAWIAAGAPAP